MTQYTPNPIATSALFPYEMRRFRRARGMTLSQLAEQMGVTVAMTSFLEKGQRVPNRNLIRRMTAALTLTPQEAGELYVAAGLLPPGQYAVDEDGRLIQAATEGEHARSRR
jgi:transcriptional regulator with XRE-family HTH domain